MAANRSALGSCPLCGEPIPEYKLLIEYQRRNVMALFAECPACREVVHPR